MPLAAKDIVPITTARAKLTELADQVARTGEGKVLTRNGESYVAIITASDFDELTAFRHEQHLSLLRAVAEGLEDVNAGRTLGWEEFQPQLQALRRRVRKQFGMSPLAAHEARAAYAAEPAARAPLKKSRSAAAPKAPAGRAKSRRGA